MITGEMVDCLASYYGFNDKGELNRYFCYHVLGGPGPTPGGGAASIVLLTVHDEAERCIGGCRELQVVETGGPAAAVAKALHFLDACHEGDRMRKMQHRPPRFDAAGPDFRSINQHYLALKEKSAMNVKRLGNSDLYITPVGFGAWAIGGAGYEWGWGAQDDADSIAAIHEALDAGANWIDTAAVYGLGHSEEVVARALHGVRQRPHVFTKCGMVWDENRQVGNRLKADSIRRECEASLRRLRVDAIDLYQIHWPKPAEDIEEGWATMAALQKEGKVRWIGVSNFTVDQLRQAQAIAPVTSLQPPYSLVKRQVEDEILPYCFHQHIGVIAYSPMASGLLTGAMTRDRVAAPAGRRLAAEKPRLPGAAAVKKPAAGPAARRHRPVPRPVAGRGRRRLGAATSGRDRRHRRRAAARPIQGRRGGGRVPPQPARCRRDRRLFPP